MLDETRYNPRPMVTVVVATYNRASLLPRALASVLAQTYTDWEVIVVDDCSSDNTPQVIAGYKDPRIRSFRNERNVGQSASRNVGILQARGKYLQFLDDDDELLPENLAVLTDAMDDASPDVGMAYGWSDVVDDSDGSTRPRGPRIALEGDVFHHLLALGDIPSCHEVLYRTAVIRELGGYDEDWRSGEDALLVCLVSRSYKVIHVPRVLALAHEEHGHARVTDNQADRWANYLKVRFNTFKADYDRNPKIKGDVLYLLAQQFYWAGDYRQTFYFLGMLFMHSPGGLVGRIAGYIRRKLSQS